MDKKQVVTINTMHTCPMTTGNTPHVGGPVIGPGCSTATLNGIPIALQGDKCICAAGGQDVILQGCPTATINGVPIALQGSPTAHGGTIPAGVPGAVIITKNTSVLEAGAEGEPAVYNLQWVKEEQIIRNSKIEKVVTLVADARNIPNGEEVTVKVHTPEQDGGSSMLTELKGIVKDNQVQVEWKVEQKEEDENAPKVTDFYLSDDKNKKISKIKYNEEHIFLHINTKNLQGKTFSIKINSPYLEYKHKDTVLNEQILKDYSITSDEEVIELQLNKPFKKGVKKTVSKFTLSIGKIGYEKTLSLKIKREEKCVVTFSLDETQDNLFGFDSYKVSKKGCKDKEKLKKAYKKLEPFREEYLMPWVSLAQYRYAILKVAVKGKYKEITFNDPQGYFTFEPATITPKTEQVKITCNDTITEKEYKVEVLADGKVAGGLMFVENSVKKLKLPINWYNVVVNPTDLGDIKRLVSKEKIKNYCKKAFTPALIEVEINEITTEIDISKLKNNLYNDIILIKDNSSFLLRPLFLAYLLHYAVTRNPYQISLYTTYIKNENIGKDEHHNGFTWHSKDLKYPSPEAEKFFIDKKIIPTLSLSKEAIEKNIQTNDKEEVCVMFLANDITYLQLDGDIPHELMHALGLEHTFEEKNHPNKEHIFSKGNTKNYMDYNNTKKTTFKWQWDILRSSKYLKILILILTLFLASCRTMSSKEIQAISCVCNDSITQEDKKLPIPPPEKIENDSLKIYVEIQPRNMYLKYIEYLKTNEQKMIYYDLEGNIKQTYLSVPYEFIGRSFIFDEQGNIKEVINHDEGWKICAFQVLAIAKKYAGENYSREKLGSPKWQVRKTKLEGKDIWVVHYLNKKNKAISLYINRDTGRIVKRVKH